MDCGRVATTHNDKMLQRFSDLELLVGHALYSTEAVRVGYQPVSAASGRRDIAANSTIYIRVVNSKLFHCVGLCPQLSCQ